MSLVRKIKNKENKFYALIYEILKGISAFGMPAPKILWVPIYYLRLWVIAVCCGLRKFFWCEPLLRAYAKSCGKYLQLSEFVPYICGQGRLELGDYVRLSGQIGFSFNSRYYENPEIKIGDNVFLGHNTSLTAAQSITIGSHSYIAGSVWMSDIDGHPIDPAMRRKGMPPSKEQVKSIKIGSNVWIGVRSIILKGVTIGDNSIVGAGAVVTKDIPANCIAVGSPAKVIKWIEGFETNSQINK